MTSRNSGKCKICDTSCGEKRGQRCQFGSNDAKRRADQIFSAAKGSLNTRVTMVAGDDACGGAEDKT